MTLVEEIAHPQKIRRKRRGMYPKGIQKIGAGIAAQAVVAFQAENVVVAGKPVDRVGLRSAGESVIAIAGPVEELEFWSRVGTAGRAPAVVVPDGHGRCDGRATVSKDG